MNIDFTKIKSRTGRYRWADYIIPFILMPLYYDKQAKGSVYDIRGLCYTLETLGVILKSTHDFKLVTRAMGTARKNGTFPQSRTRN